MLHAHTSRRPAHASRSASGDGDPVSNSTTEVPVIETSGEATSTTWSATYGGVTVQHRADHRLMGRVLPLYALARTTPTTTSVELFDADHRLIAAAHIGQPDSPRTPEALAHPTNGARRPRPVQF